MSVRPREKPIIIEPGRTGDVRVRDDSGRSARTAGRVAALAIVLVCAAVLPACGTAEPDPAAREAAAVAELDRITQTRNDADVAFVQQMLPHHEQGVELAGLVAGRTGNVPVRDMAFRITRAQGFEIGQLRGYLTAWRTDPGVGTHSGGTHGGGMDGAGGMGGAMPGMVAPDRMGALRSARGAVFDRLWLESMITHHEGAIAMADAQQRDGINRGARNTAANVISVQRAEIATMRTLLRS